MPELLTWRYCLITDEYAWLRVWKLTSSYHYVPQFRGCRVYGTTQEKDVWKLTSVYDYVCERWRVRMTTCRSFVVVMCMVCRVYGVCVYVVQGSFFFFPFSPFFWEPHILAKEKATTKRKIKKALAINKTPQASRWIKRRSWTEQAVLDSLVLTLDLTPLEHTK